MFCHLTPNLGFLENQCLLLYDCITLLRCIINASLLLVSFQKSEGIRLLLIIFYEVNIISK